MFNVFSSIHRYRPTTRRLATVVAAVMVSASATTTLFAPAALSQSVSGSSALDEAGYNLSSDALASWSYNPQLGQQLNSIFQQFHATSPWGQLPIPNIYGSPTPYPANSLRDYDQPRLIDRRPDDRFPFVERLFIESPAMKRVVQVQVLYPRDRSTPAPMLYLLDGVTAPQQSGWLREGDVQGAMAHEHVTVVMPTEATGSNYTNWNTDDPYLGRSQWETFLVEELPSVLEAPQSGFAFNGTRYIGGLSMGGSAAIRIANLYPQRYSGTFSVSGCYSTINTSGREFFNFITRSVGGTPDLIWGAGITKERRRNDVVSNPTGLKNMPVYVFTADGNVTEADKAHYRPHGAHELAGGIILEKVVHQCTREFDDAMRAHGMTHHKVDYQRGGIHDWPYYKAQLPIAWKHISSKPQ
ncbi:putative esterase [Corynebacterium mustelae]|uniref:Putative esterase n=1 Tax=Corynebacterium mustelae TaxID=571915 RepID=A0A0G3H4D6_9CORY|nr:putative esterase [Corynebacterium mustelae]